MREFNGNIQVYTPNLLVKSNIDEYKSLLWVERFYEAGEVEMFLPYSLETLSKVAINDYLVASFSTVVMLIEEITISSNTEDGDIIIVKGRSSEVLLNRRIVWGNIHLNGKMQVELQRLVSENVTNPTDTVRKIPEIVFKTNPDARLNIPILNHKFTGDNLYEIFMKLAKEKGFGFKITLDGDKLVLYILMGYDRSYDQTVLPWVVFSNNNENLVDAKYSSTDVKFKTVAKVDGEGEGSARKSVSVGNLTLTGLKRRELYVDARDIRSTGDNNSPIPEHQYLELLKQRGIEKLKEARIERVFDGEVFPDGLYSYDIDYYLGDLVQIETKHGIQAKARVIEMILSHDDSGLSMYPTFEIIGEEG